MGLSNSKNPPVIAAVNFPMYCIKLIGPKHVLVAGGGGQAKTGVANRMEIFLLELCDPGTIRNSAGTTPCHCIKTAVIDTEIRATMNMDIHPINPVLGEFLIACGQDDFCHLYRSRFDIVYMKNGQQVSVVSSNGDVSNGHNHAVQNGGLGDYSVITGQIRNGLIERKLSFSISEVVKVQSDFDKKSAFQKTVRFEPGQGRFFATGGADGSFRIFDSVSGEKIGQQQAHKDEIDNLDISPDGKFVVTVGRDSKTNVWQLKKDGIAKYTELRLPGEIPDKFRDRFVRFTTLGTRSQVFLTATVPTQRSSKNTQSFLTLWVLNPQVQSCRAMITKPVTKETISALAVSQNSELCAIGSMEGSVSILETDELKLLKHIPQTHGIFVTGLTFVPDAGMGPESPMFALSEDFRAGVLSISADQTTQMHCIPWRERMGFGGFLWWLLIGMAIFAVILRFLGM